MREIKETFTAFWEGLPSKKRESFRMKLGRELANKKIKKMIHADLVLNTFQKEFRLKPDKKTESIMREILMW